MQIINDNKKSKYEDIRHRAEQLSEKFKIIRENLR